MRSQIAQACESVQRCMQAFMRASSAGRGTFGCRRGFGNRGEGATYDCESIKRCMASIASEPGRTRHNWMPRQHMRAIRSSDACELARPAEHNWMSPGPGQAGGRRNIRYACDSITRCTRARSVGRGTTGCYRGRGNNGGGGCGGVMRQCGCAIKTTDRWGGGCGGKGLYANRLLAAYWDQVRLRSLRQRT